MTHISIFDPKVKSIPIIENNDVLFNVATLDKVIVASKYEPYYPTFKLVRQSVAKRLEKAAQELPDNVYILFVEGHRPLQVQEAYFTQYSNALKESHSNWSEEKVFQEASKLFAPPSKIPPHSTGAALDITFCDKNGKELDMGSPIDDDPDKNEGRNFLDTSNISSTAQQNRKILHNIMTKNEFANYDYEWWHWSYGDQYWAFKKDHRAALYDSIDAQFSSLWREPVIMNVLESTGI